MAAATNRVPSAAPFTQQQKEDLERLWRLQTHETQDAGNITDQIKPIDKNCVVYMTRLHAFCLAFWKKHLGVGDSPGGTGEDFLKASPGESCLELYYERFVDVESNRRSIRLGGGKMVILLHHEEFLSEMNEYEFKGCFQSDDPSCVTHCFGAFLHHRPLEALPCLNTALALAVITMWRELSHHPSENKIERFRSFCRIHVRFVHVSPQLPMADIKTGLVQKFITVKGHVVKARPRRLRVSTADL